MYFNKNFDEYVDLHDSFVFSHLQKFKIICEVITKNALTFLLLIKNFLLPSLVKTILSIQNENP